MLTLYQRLISGGVVYKSTCAIEFDITGRSFDRDIEDMRTFLSESFSWLELIYDKDLGGYRLKNLLLKPEMGLGECFILSKLLLDSHALCAGDQEAIIKLLLSQLPPEHRERARSALRYIPEKNSSVPKSSVKLVEDLLYSITSKDRITLQFGEERTAVSCVPYSLEFHTRTAYLVAWELDKNIPALYPLNSIVSYVPAREPYVLTLREQETLQGLIEKVCNQEFGAYEAYIYQEEESETDDSF